MIPGKACSVNTVMARVIHFILILLNSPVQTVIKSPKTKNSIHYRQIFLTLVYQSDVIRAVGRVIEKNQTFVL